MHRCLSYPDYGNKNHTHWIDTILLRSAKMKQIDSFRCFFSLCVFWLLCLFFFRLYFVYRAKERTFIVMWKKIMRMLVYGANTEIYNIQYHKRLSSCPWHGETRFGFFFLLLLLLFWMLVLVSAHIHAASLLWFGRLTTRGAVDRLVIAFGCHSGWIRGVYAKFWMEFLDFFEFQEIF